MATSDLAELTKSYVPTEEQRKRILDSIYGSVIGMATAALLYFGAYLIVAVTLFGFLKNDVKAYALEDPRLFWGFLIAPFVLIVISFVTPGGIRAYRERKIYKLAPAAQPVEPGYFRIRPFETDRAQPQGNRGHVAGAAGGPDGTDRALLQGHRCHVAEAAGGPEGADLARPH